MSTQDFKRATACVQAAKYAPLEMNELHRGANGKVFVLCDSSATKHCKKVVKIVRYTTEAEKHFWDREVYMFRKLQASLFVPHLYDAFHCGGFGFIVLDRYATNMEKIGRAQAVPFKRADLYVYTEKQLLQMFDIAAKLGQVYGVIHGDLKPDQYLAADSEAENMVVTDFGFSGDGEKYQAIHGWNWIPGCLARTVFDFTSLPEEQIVDLKKWFNVFQLWWRFVGSGVLLVQKEDKKYYLLPRNPDRYPFSSIPQLAMPHTFVENMLNLYRTCTGYRKVPFFRAADPDYTRWRLQFAVYQSGI